MHTPLVVIFGLEGDLEGIFLGLGWIGEAGIGVAVNRTLSSSFTLVWFSVNVTVNSDYVDVNENCRWLWKGGLTMN